MNITFATKLAGVLGRIFEHADRIDIDDYCRANYDMDTVMERIDEIKALLDDPAATDMYPYSDPFVEIRLRMGIYEVNGHKGGWKMLAKYNCNDKNIKYSKFLLHVSTSIDFQIKYITENYALGLNYYKQDTNPAMKEYIKIAQEGLEKNIQWLKEIKRRKEAGAGWGNK